MSSALQMLLCTAAAVLLTITLGTADGRTTLRNVNSFCVSPKEAQPCQTLEFYLRNHTRYFSDDTTFLFLPGKHRVQASRYSTPWIHDITNLTLVGNGSFIPGPRGSPQEPSSQIHCSGTAGFTFQNVSYLRLESLTLVGCGSKSITTSTHYPALQFRAVSYLTVFRVTVRHSTGWGVVIDSIFGNSSITASTFAYNSGTKHYTGGNMQLYHTDCRDADSIAQLYIGSSQFSKGNYHLSNREVERDKQYAGGLAMLLECSSIALDLESNNFTTNRGSKGGHLAITIKNTSFMNPIRIKSCHFEDAVAEVGAAVYMTVVQLKAPQGDRSNSCSQAHLLQISNSTFYSNFAYLHGSGMYLYTAYTELDTTLCSGGIVTVENCAFDDNLKGYDSQTGGIAIHAVKYIPEYLQQGVLKLIFTNCNFSKSYDNLTHWNSNSAVFLDTIPYASFENCSFTDNKCTGMVASNSNIMFKGQIKVEGNRGRSGGGLVLCETSLMYLSLNTTVTFSDNHAQYVGGAIHVETQCLQSTPRCFFQPRISNGSQSEEFLTSVSINFQNNSAGVAGSALYGGSVDHCYLLKHAKSLSNSTEVFNRIFHFKESEEPSFISSDPTGVCFCIGDEYDCNIRVRNVSALPGQKLEVSVVVVGQRNGAVPGIVVADAGLPSQRMQVIKTTDCTPVQYTLITNRSQPLKNVTLSAQKYSSSILPSTDIFEHPTINLLVTVEDCPFEFSLSGDPPSCKCNCSYLHCNINKTDNSGIIHRTDPLWVGTCPTDSNRIAIVRHCPFGLCTPRNVDLKTTNDSIDQDAQCAPDRTGTLCGACKPGLSLTLGSYSCRQCSNSYIPVLLSLAVGGLLLVVVLTALNLTVTEGTINGLIFYANVVHTNAATFFPPLPDSHSLKVLASIPQVFIAWINLDLGIESCFYNGMDAYAKTWLQFAFPIYIWVIAGMIVLLSRRYAIVARATGRHAVQVLATLFLLSFTKLLNTVIATMTFATIHCEPSGRVIVWEPDGNIEFLKGVHIPLFLAGLTACLLFSLPYALILMFAQCLQRLNFRLVWRLKPLFDAYTGPYKDACRFWTGHLLLIRGVLFVAYASIDRDDAAPNFLLALVVSTHLLLLSVWVFRGVYKRHSLDVLESSFFLNLAILLVIALMDPQHPERLMRVRATYTSVTIALLTFVGIVIFHGYRQLTSFKLWNDFLNWLSRKNQHENAQEVQQPLLRDQDSTAATDSEGSMIPYVPALAPMTRFDQYREPVLGFEDST